MRTTLTLDDDVAALLERVRKRQGAGLKAVINMALREGLRQMNKPEEPRKPFRTRTVSLGRCYLPTLDSIPDALAAAEGERFR